MQNINTQRTLQKSLSLFSTYFLLISILMSEAKAGIIDWDGGSTGGRDLEVTVVDMSQGYMFADGSIDTASADIVGPAFTAANVTVYRVWVHVDSALSKVAGAGGSVINNYDLNLASSNGLFVNELLVGTNVGSGIQPLFFTFMPSLAWDSWLTIGTAGNIANVGNITIVDNEGAIGDLTVNVLGQNNGWFITPLAGAGVVSNGVGGWRVLLAQLVVAEGETVNGWIRVFGGGDDMYFHFDSVPAAPVDCNNNGIPDSEDIASGSSQDLNNNGIPDECDCLADNTPVNADGSTGNGVVNIDDLVLVLSTFGQTPQPGDPPLQGDVNFDGFINLDDLLIILSNFGLCP